MSKHTPGPWIQRGYCVVGGNPETLVADCVCDRPDSGLWYANAKLIAAAPELAEATRDLLKAFRDCIGAPAFWEFEQGNPAVRAAMRALAKAGL